MSEPLKRTALARLHTGEDGILLEFQSGRAEQNRLASLGFTPGAQVNMTQNYGHGPLIVTVRGTRVALGRGEAERIVVEACLHE